MSTRATAATFPEIVSKLGQAYDALENKYPLYQTPGFDIDNDGIVDTLASIDAKYTNYSDDKRAQLRADLRCGQKPASPTDIEAWGDRRKCLQAANIILARHHIFRYLAHGQNEEDKKRAATHLYLTAIELDAATTGQEQSNVFNVTQGIDPSSTYKVRDSGRQARYLLDSGAPKDFGISYSLGMLPRYYCTTLELPFDEGKNCKTINLWERIRRVAAASATRGASEWLIHTDGTLRTEYWNSPDYWDFTQNHDQNMYNAYWVYPNQVFDPASGRGWYDLLGRRTMGMNLSRQNMSPAFFMWVSAGTADNSKLVLNEGGIFKTAFDFGNNLMAFSTAFDRYNWLGNFTTQNVYGYSTRAISGRCSLNSIRNDVATNPLDVCTDGRTELYRYTLTLESDESGFPAIHQLAYNGQHLLNDANDWTNLPDLYKQNALNFYYAFRSMFYKDGQSFINFNNGGYDESVIQNYYPNRVGNCNATGYYNFYRGPSGRVVYLTGETAAEIIPTFVSYYYDIVKLQDQGKADELLSITDQLLNPIITTPLNPNDTACAPGSGGPGALNLYTRRSVLTANLILGWYGFQKLPLATIPKICDINADLTINAQDIKIGLNDYSKSQTDCSEDIFNNTFDFAKTAYESGKSTPLPVSIPIASTAPTVTAISHMDLTYGDNETLEASITGQFPRSKTTVISSDGTKIYYKLNNTHGFELWDKNWGSSTISQMDIGIQSGQTAFRSFSQSLAPPPLNKPKQIILALNGQEFWYRYFENGAWITLTHQLTTDLNIIDNSTLITKVSSLAQTQGDDETKDPATRQNRAKIMAVSADGTKIYVKFHNTNGSNTWDSNWIAVVVANTTLGTDLGITAIRSFTQGATYPHAQPQQIAVSLDGRTHWVRFWSQGIWGSWHAYPVEELMINDATSTILPPP